MMMGRSTFDSNGTKSRKRKRKQIEDDFISMPSFKRRRTTSYRVVYHHLTEKKFHQDVVKRIRKEQKLGNLPIDLIIAGHPEGNLPYYNRSAKKNRDFYSNRNRNKFLRERDDAQSFSNRMGYIKHDADIPFIYKSPYGFLGLDIELKVRDQQAREGQRKMLIHKFEQLNHLTTCINTKDGGKNAEERIIILLKKFTGRMKSNRFQLLDEYQIY